MIQSISIILPQGKKEVLYKKNHKYKVTLELEPFMSSALSSFDLEITFVQPIVQYRSHDYQWIDAKTNWVANEFCPKIVRLSNGLLVQANVLAGIWEVHQRKKSVLLWRFNPQYAATITQYTLPANDRYLKPATACFASLPSLALLFSNQNAIEFSRSKIPFSAIVCFTDHCDFDTAENLALQRQFFKENNIKVTKGFFINHFSKRTENASYEHDAAELELWRQDGHELCYHSLTQSLRSPAESRGEFFSFQPPFSNLTTWIDHGYQPYNFSLFAQHAMANREYEANLKDKNIQNLWNYIDSGTATHGVINQLNPQHFTLASFLKGNKELAVYPKAQVMIKNIVFHFFGTPELLAQYRKVAGYFKKVVFQKQVRLLLPLLQNGSGLLRQMAQVFLSWPITKNKPYTLSQYQTVFFKHMLNQQEFYVFQTLEMLDFKKALCSENLDLLVKEKGVFLAHTYFSVPLSYHNGKLFETPHAIDPIVTQNFQGLGQKIKDKTIWNPTLQEWISYWKVFDSLIFDSTELGEIVVSKHNQVFFRTIH